LFVGREEMREAKLNVENGKKKKKVARKNLNFGATPTLSPKNCRLPQARKMRVVGQQRSGTGIDGQCANHEQNSQKKDWPEVKTNCFIYTEMWKQE
jgi:hypothetical protein